MNLKFQKCLMCRKCAKWTTRGWMKQASSRNSSESRWATSSSIQSNGRVLSASTWLYWMEVCLIMGIQILLKDRPVTPKLRTQKKKRTHSSHLRGSRSSTK